VCYCYVEFARASNRLLSSMRIYEVITLCSPIPRMETALWTYDYLTNPMETSACTLDLPHSPRTFQGFRHTPRTHLCVSLDIPYPSAPQHEAMLRGDAGP